MTKSKSKEYFIDLIIKKLKNHSSRKINLEKKQFTEFIDYLIYND